MEQKITSQETPGIEESSNSSLDQNQTTTTTTTLQSTISPQIGHVYSAKRLDGEWHPAEVLETRLNDVKSKRTEYFVHFENCKIYLTTMQF